MLLSNTDAVFTGAYYITPDRVPSATKLLILLVYFLSAASVNVPGMYRYWPDQQTQQSSSRSCQSSSVRNSHHPPPFTEERPSELESRLEVLHSQLNR